MKERTETFEPHCRKARMDIEEPIFKQSSTDIISPKLALP
jgi:hypothetical protein